MPQPDPAATVATNLRAPRQILLNGPTRAGLAQSRRAAGVDQFSEAMDEADPEVIEAVRRLESDRGGLATGALVALGGKAIQAIDHALSHTNKNIRGNIAADVGNAIHREALSREAARVLIPSLIRNLSDAEDVVRWPAAAALGAIHLDPELSIPALSGGLRDPHPHVQAACAEALGYFGDSAAEFAPQIAAMYEGARIDHKNQVLRALGHFPSATDVVLPVLLKAMVDEDPLARMTAAGSLSVLKARPDVSLPPLFLALQDQEDFVRGSAANALGFYGAPEAVPALIKALEDPSQSVRMNATVAVSRITGKPPQPRKAE